MFREMADAASVTREIIEQLHVVLAKVDGTLARRVQEHYFEASTSSFSSRSRSATYIVYSCSNCSSSCFDVAVWTPRLLPVPQYRVSLFHSACGTRLGFAEGATHDGVPPFRRWLAPAGLGT
jgi:hypothetical protein